jgi:hypothetical protein
MGEHAGIATSNRSVQSSANFQEQDGMADSGHAPSSLWLRLLGGAVIALMGAGLAYAVVIAVLRFPQIGV